MNTNFLNPALSTASGKIPLTSLNTIGQGVNPAALDILPPSSFLFDEGSYYVDGGVVKARDGSAAARLPVVARSMIGIASPFGTSDAGRTMEKLMRDMPKTTPFKGESGEQEAVLGLGQGIPVSASNRGAAMFALTDEGSMDKVGPTDAAIDMVWPPTPLSDEEIVAFYKNKMEPRKRIIEEYVKEGDLNQVLQRIRFEGINPYERVIKAAKRIFEKRGDLKADGPLRQELSKELKNYRDDIYWYDKKFLWLLEKNIGEDLTPSIRSLIREISHARRVEGQMFAELGSCEDAAMAFDAALFQGNDFFFIKASSNDLEYYQFCIEQADILLEKADVLGHSEERRAVAFSKAHKLMDRADTMPISFDGGKREEFAHQIKLSGLRERIARGMGDNGQLLGIYAKRLLIYNELGFYMRDQFAAKKINAGELAKSERECLDATVDILGKKMDVWRSEGHFGLVAKAAEDIRKVIHRDAVSEYRKTGDKNILYRAYERMREHMSAEAKALKDANEYLRAAAAYARLMTINKLLARHPLNAEQNGFYYKNKFYYNEAARDARYFLTNALKKDEKAEAIIQWAFDAYISSPWRRFWARCFNMSRLEMFVEKYGKLDKIFHKMRDKLKNRYTIYDRDFSGLGKFNNNLLEFAKHGEWTARTGWRKDVPLERDPLGIPY